MINPKCECPSRAAIGLPGEFLEYPPLGRVVRREHRWQVSIPPVDPGRAAPQHANRTIAETEVDNPRMAAAELSGVLKLGIRIREAAPGRHRADSHPRWKGMSHSMLSATVMLAEHEGLAGSVGDSGDCTSGTIGKQPFVFGPMRAGPTGGTACAASIVHGGRLIRRAGREQDHVEPGVVLICCGVDWAA